MPAWQGGYRKPARPVEETPGPGKYNIPENKTGPQYTMESRHHARKREPSPGSLPITRFLVGDDIQLSGSLVPSAILSPFIFLLLIRSF